MILNFSKRLDELGTLATDRHHSLSSTYERREYDTYVEVDRTSSLLMPDQGCYLAANSFAHGCVARESSLRDDGLGAANTRRLPQSGIFTEIFQVEHMRIWPTHWG